MQRRRAYTLFELVVTTAVVAMTAALAMPSIEGMSGPHKLNAAVDGVRTAWAQGRAHAVEEGKPYRFAITDGGKGYRLAAEDSADSTNANHEGSGFVIDEKLPTGVQFAGAGDNAASIDSGDAVAVFLPDGTARNDVEIRFEVRGARPATVKLRSLTGAVTVERSESKGGAR